MVATCRKTSYKLVVPEIFTQIKRRESFVATWTALPVIFHSSLHSLLSGKESGRTWVWTFGLVAVRRTGGFHDLSALQRKNRMGITIYKAVTNVQRRHGVIGHEWVLLPSGPRNLLGAPQAEGSHAEWQNLPEEQSVENLLSGAPIVHTSSETMLEDREDSAEIELEQQSTLRHRQLSLSTNSSQPLAETESITFSDDSSYLQYVPFALSFSDRLYQTSIIVQNGQYWEDRAVMRMIQQAYWETRGIWKRWPSTMRIWPWRTLREIGYAKVEPRKGCTDVL